MKDVLKFSFLVLASFWSTLAVACPCGCGSVKADTLFPGETAKASVFSSITPKRYYYDQNGKNVGELEGDLVELGSSATFSASRDLSVGGSVSWVKDTGSESEVLKEPSIYASYVVHQYDFTREYLPLSIVTLSYSPEMSDDLVVHRGYQTLSLSTANWFTLGNDNFGFGMSIIKKLNADNEFTQNIDIDRGYAYGVSVGYTRITPPIGQYGLGYDLNGSTLTKMNGENIEDSDISSDTVRVYAGIRVAEKTNSQLEFSQDSVFFSKNNQAASKITLTVSRTF